MPDRCVGTCPCSARTPVIFVPFPGTLDSHIRGGQWGGGVGWRRTGWRHPVRGRSSTLAPARFMERRRKHRLLPSAFQCRLPRLPAVGDTIPISYNNKRYYIDIIEAQPGDAISVVETDCNVRRRCMLGMGGRARTAPAPRSQAGARVAGQLSHADLPSPDLCDAAGGLCPATGLCGTRAGGIWQWHT